MGKKWRWCLAVMAVMVLSVSAVHPQEQDGTETQKPTETAMTLAEVKYAVKYIESAPPDETERPPWREEAEYIARTIYGEARGCSTTEQAAVAWCILNRVDSEDAYYPDDIIGVVTQKKQFHGYDERNPVEPELYGLALDVIERWQTEKAGAQNVGRVLPTEYLYFSGDGQHNYFRTSWDGGRQWDWSLPSPYEQ